MPAEPDPSRVGANVAHARKRMGLTQEAIAKELRVSRPTYIAIESGQRALTDAQLATIAASLRTSVRELLQLETPDSIISLRFRALRENQETRHAIDALEHFGRLYATLERLAQVHAERREPPVFRLEGIRNLERAADELASTERLRLGLGDGPLPNLRGLLEEDVGLRIFGLTDMSSLRIAGIFAYSAEFGPLVGFNCAHDPRRIRWTLCHEYAHFLTDRFDPEVTVDDGSRRNRREVFADAFAARFLLPQTGLSRRFTELMSDAGGKGTLAHLVMLAQFFEVSFEAVTRRLEEIGRIVPGTSDMVRERGFQPAKAEQALGIERQPTIERLPLRYTYLVATLYARGEISEGDVTRFLQTDRLSARELLQAVEPPDDAAEASLSTPIEVSA